MSEFKVPDMNCGHCEKAITGALKKAGPEVEVRVDLKEKILTVKNLPDETVAGVLKELGYTPERMK
jgi:copper chaperone